MPTGGESMIALEQLDSHIKAILKLKLRAFVHLNPCFEDTHSIDIGLRQAHHVDTAPGRVRNSQVASISQPVTDSAPLAVARPAPLTASVPSAATGPASEVPLFPPIPERVESDFEQEVFNVQRFTANLAFSIEQSAQPCPNRLVAARARRRARA